jgi:DNA-binding IclR family transcriptional regulator
VPVHDGGTVVGAVAVLGSAPRFPRSHLHRTGQLVRQVLAHHQRPAA